jgi:hypothetical protein
MPEAACSWFLRTPSAPVRTGGFYVSQHSTHPLVGRRWFAYEGNPSTQRRGLFSPAWSDPRGAFVALFAARFRACLTRTHACALLTGPREMRGPRENDTMLRTSTATAAVYLLSAMTPLLAQTTTPPAGGTAGTAGTAATGGGLADWWWIILLVILAGAAIWYFTSRKGRV